jgi:hypothetical protein
MARTGSERPNEPSGERFAVKWFAERSAKPEKSPVFSSELFGKPFEASSQAGAQKQGRGASEPVDRLALGRGFGSQAELAERFGGPKSTVSEWLNEWTKANGFLRANTSASAMHLQKSVGGMQ